MFPEYRDLISKLKTEDTRFSRLFNQHNELDQDIKNKENTITELELEKLKKEKLRIKDEIYAILRKSDSSKA